MMIRSQNSSTSRGSLLFAFALSLALGVVPASANLLFNNSFETGDLTGWNFSGAVVDASGAPGAGAQDGSFALLLNNDVGDGVAEANQGAFGLGPLFAASPGDEFNLSGFMLTEAALPAGATFGLFKIVFEDAAGNDLIPDSVSIGLLNTVNPGAESVPFLNDVSPIGTWNFSETQAVAPAGTASAQFLVLNVDFGNGGNHPMYFDNVSALLVPEPGSLALFGLGALLIAGVRRRRALA